MQRAAGPFCIDARSWQQTVHSCFLGKMQTKYRNNVMDDSEKWFCVPFFEPLFGAVFSVIFHVTAKSAKIADKLSVVFGYFIFSLYLD